MLNDLFNKRTIHEQGHEQLNMWLNSFTLGMTLVGMFLLFLGLIFAEVVAIKVGFIFIVLPFLCALLFALSCSIIVAIGFMLKVLADVLPNLYKWDI